MFPALITMKEEMLEHGDRANFTSETRQSKVTLGGGSSIIWDHIDHILITALTQKQSIYQGLRRRRTMNEDTYGCMVSITIIQGTKEYESSWNIDRLKKADP